MRALLATMALTIAMLAAAPSPIAAEEARPTPSLAWLIGDWEGQSTFLRRKARVQLAVAPVLNGTAISLSYNAEIPASVDAPAFRFEARGIYRLQAEGRIIGQWSDSQGNFHPLAGKLNGTEMLVNWGEVRTELGHSSYVLDADGNLTVTDSAFSRGAVREFAKAIYRRKPSG